jgi:hypothetical protein
MRNKYWVFIEILGIIFLLVSSFILGWFVKPVSYSEKKYDGCWYSVKNPTSLDDWVCVNIGDMSYERALEVCSHEVGHEIFAEECEKNITKCMEAVGK